MRIKTSPAKIDHDKPEKCSVPKDAPQVAKSTNHDVSSGASGASGAREVSADGHTALADAIKNGNAGEAKALAQKLGLGDGEAERALANQMDDIRIANQHMQRGNGPAALQQAIANGNAGLSKLLAQKLGLGDGEAERALANQSDDVRKSVGVNAPEGAQPMLAQYLAATARHGVQPGAHSHSYQGYVAWAAVSHSSDNLYSFFPPMQGWGGLA